MPETAAINALMLLAQEHSSDKRRELLHAVTDLFLASPSISTAQSELFDDVMTRVANEAGTEGRRDLAERIAPVGHAPRGIVNNLARDEDVSVASPVLRQSTVLTNEDLVEIAESHGDGHMEAMSERQSIGSIVTDVLIRRGNHTVLRRVSGNKGAELSELGARTLSQKAVDDYEIQSNLYKREDLPEAVTKEVQERGDPMGDALHQQVLASPIRQMLPRIVAQFAQLSGLEAPRVQRMMLEERLDLLVIICRALEMNDITFEDMLRYRAALAGKAHCEVDELIEQFNMLPVNDAQRMARFLKVRQSAA
ncbi:MAG: DUF2336 domain-containing protein [Tepidamorphaceae bacterium]